MDTHMCDNGVWLLRFHPEIKADPVLTSQSACIRSCPLSLSHYVTICHDANSQLYKHWGCIYSYVTHNDNRGALMRIGPVIKVPTTSVLYHHFHLHYQIGYQAGRCRE